MDGSMCFVSEFNQLLCNIDARRKSCMFVKKNKIKQPYPRRGGVPGPLFISFTRTESSWQGAAMLPGRSRDTPLSVELFFFKMVAILKNLSPDFVWIRLFFSKFQKLPSQFFSQKARVRRASCKAQRWLEGQSYKEACGWWWKRLAFKNLWFLVVRLGNPPTLLTWLLRRGSVAFVKITKLKKDK